MGYGSRFHRMIFIVTFLFISLERSHILIADGLLLDGLQQLYFMEETVGNHNKVEKFSGQYDNDRQKDDLIVQKFKTLFRWNVTTSRVPLYGVAPSPSPNIQAEISVPALAPGPAPQVAHFHRAPPQSITMPPPHKTHKGNTDGRRIGRVLVLVLVSAGAAFLAGVLGFICFCRREGRTGGRSKYKSDQISSSKVRLNPGMDLFYLDTLVDLEQQSMCLKQSILNKEVAVLESQNVSSSSTREIMPVHEGVETGRYDSDVESFHSFVDSHSSNAILSDDASAVSLTASSHIPINITNTSSSLPPAPPPPPPPPLPPVVRISPSNTSLSATSDTSVGKDGSPLPKLKPLHWDKVRAAPDRCMVWDKLRSSSFEVDEETIESLFGYNIHNPMKNDETKSKTPSPSNHILELKRLQNITILLKAMNLTPEQACNALMKGSGLVLQQLEALVKMVPTKEEEAKLYSYNGDINELGYAEKFIKELLSIPFAFLRAEAMLFRETFEDELIHLKNSFSMLEEACKELRSSRLFLKLLEAVLKTGNRMNVGTTRGGASAFKLDTLLKLADVKGTDGKTSLLHFVVQEIIRSEGIRVSSDSITEKKINQKNKAQTAEEKEEDYKRMGLDLVSGLSTELYHVKKTATIDLDVLATSVLSNGKNKLKNLVTKELSRDEKNGDFVLSMVSFLEYAENNLKELQEDEDRVLLQVREITEYFHGDVSKLDEANPLGIFVIVRDFLGMLDHVCKELRNFKIRSSPSPLAPFR